MKINFVKKLDEDEPSETGGGQIMMDLIEFKEIF